MAKLPPASQDVQPEFTLFYLIRCCLLSDKICSFPHDMVIQIRSFFAIPRG
jgi:hypothetical protein